MSKEKHKQVLNGNAEEGVMNSNQARGGGEVGRGEEQSSGKSGGGNVNGGGRHSGSL